MTLACDAIILIAAIIIIVSGTKKGFVKSFMGLIKGAAAAIAAYAYTPMLSAYINNNYVHSKITDSINETLLSMALDTTTDLYDLDKLAGELPAPLVSILERYNITVSDFVSKAIGLNQISADDVYNVSSQIASPTSSIISSAIAYVLIFVGALIVLSLLTALLDLIFKLPVLSFANKLCGFIFGCAEAYLFVCILAVVLSVLVGALGSISPDNFGYDIVENTVLCKYFSEHNPISVLYNVLK